MTQSASSLMSLTSPNQTATVTADFGPMLPTGVTIASVTSVTMTVQPNAYFPGTDSSPSSRILGSPQIGESPAGSPTAGRANAAVLQQVGKFVETVRYAIDIAALGSDGNTYELWQYWTADYPGMPGT